MTIIIRGREYAVEKVDSNTDELGLFYRLTGKRGAKYYTARNRIDLTKMFIIPDNFMKGFKTMDRVWLTDATGELKVYSE